MQLPHQSRAAISVGLRLAAVLFRPTHCQVSRVVELALPSFELGDAFGIAVLGELGLARALRNVAPEPTANLPLVCSLVLTE